MEMCEHYRVQLIIARYCILSFIYTLFNSTVNCSYNSVYNVKIYYVQRWIITGFCDVHASWYLRWQGSNSWQIWTIREGFSLSCPLTAEVISFYLGKTYMDIVDNEVSIYWTTTACSPLSYPCFQPRSELTVVPNVCLECLLLVSKGLQLLEKAQYPFPIDFTVIPPRHVA